MSELATAKDEAELVDCQRDMVASRIFRLGINLFGGKDSLCRRRVSECAGTKPSLVEEPSLYPAKTFPVSTSESGYHKVKSVTASKFVAGSTTFGGCHDDCNSEATGYKKWLSERKALRNNLEQCGMSKLWLKSKSRTPLEHDQLTNLEKIQLQPKYDKKFDSSPESQVLTDAKKRFDSSPESQVLTDAKDESNFDMLMTADDEGKSEQDKHVKFKRGFSSISGGNGILATSYKQEEIEQFSKLVSYCNKKEIILNENLTEKALLLPIDESKSFCQSKLMGSTRSSTFYMAQSDTESKSVKRRQKNRFFKTSLYRRAEFMKLPTGDCKIEAKVDCWLSFDQYSKLTINVMAMPKSKSTSHNSAFWPGSVLDKLMVWIPCKNLKSRSLHSMFYPVPDFNFCSEMCSSKKQRCSWPDNDKGYVQFGSNMIKQYQL